MVVVRGKSSRGTPGARQVRTALALVLTFGAGQACGSRSMLNTDEEEAGASGDANGGTSGSAKGGTGGTGLVSDGGSYGIGGSNGGTGASPGKGGGPGKGGTGYGGTYGKGGGPSNGGTYGKGGSAGYPMMAGGAYPTGGYGATSPGYGGTYGKGGRIGRGGSGGTYGGKGGWAGAAGEAGAAGVGGGGIGGVGGSPAVIEACEEACNNLPSSCPYSNSYNECLSGCVPLSGEYPGCALELADYVNCLAANLSPGAVCMVDDSGGCYGQGCLDTAQSTCQPWLDTFADCESNGCATGYGTGPGYCSYQTYCPTHEHATECKLSDPSSDTWYCVCRVDSSVAFETYIEGYGTATCQALSEACNLAL